MLTASAVARGRHRQRADEGAAGGRSTEAIEKLLPARGVHVPRGECAQADRAAAQAGATMPAKRRRRRIRYARTGLLRAPWR
eukprot:2413759-Prymnesium_polylepis.2